MTEHSAEGALVAWETWPDGSVRRAHDWDEPDDNHERGHAFDCWCRTHLAGENL